MRCRLYNTKNNALWDLNNNNNNQNWRKLIISMQWIWIGCGCVVFSVYFIGIFIIWIMTKRFIHYYDLKQKKKKKFTATNFEIFKILKSQIKSDFEQIAQSWA